jgi:hypothetical protein
VTFDAAIIADALANVFGAMGAFALAHEIRRADPFGPAARRIVFALRIVATLFLLRAVSWMTGNAAASHAVDLLAASTPLVSLFVAEGLMRRHAPRWLKFGLFAVPFLLLLVKALPVVPTSVVAGVLVVGVCGGYLGVAGFLWWRDENSLTSAENANIRRVLFALVVLAPLILTDFRSVWPDVPVRLGAVGALLLLYLGFGTGGLHVSAMTRLGTISVFVAIAVIFALGNAATGSDEGAAQFIRVAVVGFSGLLLAAIISESRAASSGRDRASIPLLTAESPQIFEARLREHPLLGGAHLLSGEELDQVRDPAFDSLLAECSILRRSAAPWGRSLSDDGVERALSLMTAYDATDLAVLTRSPLRLLMFSLPAVSRDAKSEADIQLARLVGELAFTKEDRA